MPRVNFSLNAPTTETCINNGDLIATNDGVFMITQLLRKSEIDCEDCDEYDDDLGYDDCACSTCAPEKEFLVVGLFNLSEGKLIETDLKFNGCTIKDIGMSIYLRNKGFEFIPSNNYSLGIVKDKE